MNLRTALLAIAGVSLIQAQPASHPRFEVASVKPCNNPPRSVGLHGGPGSPGRLTLNCEPLSILIQRAYLIYRDGRVSGDPFFLVPITGGPSWIDTDRYDIDAKAESPQSEGMMMGPMLQALLEDRFRLKVHREPRQIPIYALTVAKGGSKLQPAREDSCISMDPTAPPAPPAAGQRPFCGALVADANGRMEAYGLSLASLCLHLSGTLSQKVSDQTGLSGKFDIHLDLTRQDLIPRPPGLATDPDAPDPLAAIQRALAKLGLQLELTKGQGEALVIDHVEKPSGN